MGKVLSCFFPNPQPQIDPWLRVTKCEPAKKNGINITILAANSKNIVTEISTYADCVERILTACLEAYPYDRVSSEVSSYDGIGVYFYVGDSITPMNWLMCLPDEKVFVGELLNTFPTIWDRRSQC